MTRFSVAFIGDGTMLRRCLHTARRFPEADVQVVIHSQSDAEVTTDLAAYCSRNQIELRDYELDSTLRLLDSMRPDYLFSIYTPVLLPEALLSTCGRPINFHPAPLPRYAGVNGPSWAIFQGETRYGVTWHIMNSRFDYGDIVCQQCFDIPAHWDVADLILKGNDVGEALFRGLLQSAAAGRIVTEPQRLAERTYFSKRQQPYGGIFPLDAPLEQLERLRRATAYYPLPNPFFLPRITISDRSFYLVKYRLSSRCLPFAPGLLLSVSDTEISLALRHGQLIVETVQDPRDASPVNAAEYARQNAFRAGQIASTA